MKKFNIKNLSSEELKFMEEARQRLRQYTKLSAEQVDEEVEVAAKAIYDLYDGYVVDEFFYDRIDEVILRETGKKTLRQVNEEQARLGR